MNPRLRALLLPGLLTLCVGALLVGLGVWQLHRLSWKDAIIARIEARTKSAPQPLPPASDWPRLRPDDYDYRRVALDGAFRQGASTLVFRGSAEGPGYLLLTPFDLRSGGSVFVNRGFVPADLKGEADRSAAPPLGETHITGLMRPPEARNMFTPADEPSRNTFFIRDPGPIAAHLGLADAAPFTVDVDAAGKPGAWPRGGTTVLAIPNNHFSYALTWFGLALGLVGVFAAFAWRSLEPQRHPSPADARVGAPLRR